MPRSKLSQQEKEELLLQYYKANDNDIESSGGNSKILRAARRERMYFILALVFGFLFNLSASAVDNLVQMFSTGERPSPHYFTYASIVVALSLSVVVWMLGRVRDLGQYELLIKRKQPPKEKKS